MQGVNYQILLVWIFAIWTHIWQDSKDSSYSWMSDWWSLLAVSKSKPRPSTCKFCIPALAHCSSWKEIGTRHSTIQLTQFKEDKSWLSMAERNCLKQRSMVDNYRYSLSWAVCGPIIVNIKLIKLYTKNLGSWIQEIIQRVRLACMQPASFPVSLWYLKHTTVRIPEHKARSKVSSKQSYVWHYTKFPNLPTSHKRGNLTHL